MNWLKKIMSWFTGSKPGIPEAPKKNPYPPLMQDMIDAGAPMVNPPPPVKGRGKRPGSGQPPRR